MIILGLAVGAAVMGITEFNDGLVVNLFMHEEPTVIILFSL